jgi:hypothetical protein
MLLRKKLDLWIEKPTHRERVTRAERTIFHQRANAPQARQAKVSEKDEMT